MILAPLNRSPENVRVIAIIISELKFRDVQRHIFCAHFVERADHAAFEDRPEALNRVGVDRTDRHSQAATVCKAVT
jgi:hypothetical protein